MNRGDLLVERLANWFQQQADHAAAQGGVQAKLAEVLAEDAAFLRQLKPSLIVARARGEAPKDAPPGAGAPVAPSRPQLPEQPQPDGEGGPNPLVVVGAAFVAGIVIAKLIDWRGHAHPRD